MLTLTRMDRRKKLALAVAVLADVAQGGLFAAMPALSWIPSEALDVVVSVVLVVLLGFRWRLLLALGVELIPAAQLFPSWTAFVLSMPPAKAVLPARATA